MKIGNNHCRTESSDVTFKHNDIYYCIQADFVGSTKNQLYNIKRKVIKGIIDTSFVNHKWIIITLQINKNLTIEKL